MQKRKIMQKRVSLFVGLLMLAMSPFVAEAQDIASFTRIVKELASSKYQGRGYARDGVVKAGRYLEQEFWKAGCDTVFQQPFEIDINTFPGKMKMSVDGRRLRAGEDFVMREYSPGVHGTYGLYFVDTAHYDIDRIVADLDKPENRGAMVVCDFWFPYRHRDFRILETGEAGNAGVIYTWDTPLKFYKAYGNKVVEKPVVWATREALSGSKSVRFDIDNQFLAHYESCNIVASVKGRRHDSCFVFTAHYDHLGNLGGKIFCPGVNDNASGTAAVVTLAAHYAQQRPEFDIWFVAFAGEETGLNGSTFFAEHPCMELGRIKYLFNLDMIGDDNPVQYCEVSEAGRAGFERLGAINSACGLFRSLRLGDLAANSDHYPFAQKGVPCILFEQEEGSCFQYYHTPKDDMEHFCTVTYPKLFRLLTEYVKTECSPIPVDFNEGVELMALVWRLMGDPPFCLSGYTPYCQSADNYFAPYKNHPVVAKAREFAEQEGVGYDAVAAFGLHLLVGQDGHLSFDGELVEGSDASFARWSPQMRNVFLPLLQDFCKKSRYHAWYATTDSLRSAVLEAFAPVARELDLSWYDRYFGPQPDHSHFGIVLSLLCGQNNYGCSATMRNGGRRVTPVMSGCQTDRKDNPIFRKGALLPILVHEFCHPYCNPLDAQHWEVLSARSTELFELNKEQLARQAYSTPRIMLDETFVRSCVIRYLLAHYPTAISKDALVDNEVRQGFLLVPDVVEVLGRYEQHQDRYGTIEAFMPEYARCVNSFDVAACRQALEEGQNQKPTYTCNIVDGATDIPSGEVQIVITFSKPMQPVVSLGYGRGVGSFPPLAQGAQSVKWNEEQTEQRISVRLEPHTTYSFSINRDRYRSQDGHPAQGPELITFTTK